MEDNDLTNWRTSTYSSNGGATCVEAADRDGRVLVRDTTNRQGGMLTIPGPAWTTFVESLKSSLGRGTSRGSPTPPSLRFTLRVHVVCTVLCHISGRFFFRVGDLDAQSRKIISLRLCGQLSPVRSIVWSQKTRSEALRGGLRRCGA